MKNWLTGIKTWMEGRKTYILAAVVCLVADVLVWLHRLTPDMALSLALFALSGFAATFRAALQRHHEEVLMGLTYVAEAGADVAAHKLPAAVIAGEQAVETAVNLGTEIKQEASTNEPA